MWSFAKTVATWWRQSPVRQKGVEKIVIKIDDQEVVFKIDNPLVEKMYPGVISVNHSVDHTPAYNTENFNVLDIRVFKIMISCQLLTHWTILLGYTVKGYVIETVGVYITESQYEWIWIVPLVHNMTCYHQRNCHYSLRQPNQITIVLHIFLKNLFLPWHENWNKSVYKSKIINARAFECGTVISSLRVFQNNALSARFHCLRQIFTIFFSITKITISSLAIGLKMSYFPLIPLPSCYQTVCCWIVCYWTV